jgi:peptidoglycan/LPS O-acetylase OafA/YrhL
MGAIRLFLAFVVAAGHWVERGLSFPERPWTDRLLFGFNAGYAVMFFYVISGFLITYTLSRNYERSLSGAARFYQNRFIRIFALYWPMAILALSTVDSAWRNFVSFDLIDKLTGLFLLGIDWRLMFTAHPDNRWDAALPGLHQAWTLGAELTFYILAPLLMRSWKIGAVLLLLSVGLRAAFIWSLPPGSVTSDWLYLFAPSTFVFFMLGHLSCLAGQRYGIMLRRGWWIGLLLASLIVMELLPRISFDTPRFWISILLFALAVPGIFAGTKNVRWLNYLGDLSYPVYLVHDLVFLWVGGEISAYFVEGHTARLLNSLISCAVFFAVVFVAAAAVRVLLERPAAALMRAAFTARRRAPAVLTPGLVGKPTEAESRARPRMRT